jgi:hypothetical protein
VNGEDSVEDTSAMTYSDDTITNAVAFTLVAAVAVAFLLLGYHIAQELFANQLPPALTGSP